MTDRELLELAAKAAGFKLEVSTKDCAVETFGFGYLAVVYTGGGLQFIPWNPLANDGDALRLAVRLCLYVRYHQPLGQGLVTTTGGDEYRVNVEDCGRDPCAATRRAIVIAAAELGATHD